MYQNANEMLIVCRIKKIDMVDFKTNIIYMRIFLRMQWLIKNFQLCLNITHIGLYNYI